MFPILPSMLGNIIRELVDSLYGDGVDTQYMQYLSKSHNFPTNILTQSVQKLECKKMACQRVCKLSRDDIKVMVSIESSMPTSSHYRHSSAKKMQGCGFIY